MLGEKHIFQRVKGQIQKIKILLPNVRPCLKSVSLDIFGGIVGAGAKFYCLCPFVWWCQSLAFSLNFILCFNIFSYFFTFSFYFFNVLNIFFFLSPKHIFAHNLSFIHSFYFCLCVWGQSVLCEAM